VQYPGLQGGGALGDASTPATPAGSIAASAHGGTYSHVAVAGETWGGEKGAAAGTAAAAARRRRATPTGGAFTPRRSAPLTAPLDGRLQTRPHQEYFGKGITRVYFSGIYSYSRDFSVLPPYPYSVNEQWSDTRET